MDMLRIMYCPVKHFFDATYYINDVYVFIIIGFLKFVIIGMHMYTRILPTTVSGNFLSEKGKNKNSTITAYITNT